MAVVFLFFFVLFFVFGCFVFLFLFVINKMFEQYLDVFGVLFLQIEPVFLLLQWLLSSEVGTCNRKHKRSKM